MKRKRLASNGGAIIALPNNARMLLFVFPLVSSYVSSMTDNAAPAATPTKAASPKKAKATGPKKPKTTPSHPPVASMVNSAIKNLKERGGSSAQAIKKYIAANNKCDVEKLTPFIKRYLKSAVTKGTLVQTKGKGASGSFKLKEKAEKKKTVAAAKPKKAPAAKKEKKTTAGDKKPKTPKKKSATKKAAAGEKKPKTPKKKAAGPAKKASKPNTPKKPKVVKKAAAAKKPAKKTAAKKQ